MNNRQNHSEYMSMIIGAVGKGADSESTFVKFQNFSLGIFNPVLHLKFKKNWFGFGKLLKSHFIG